jgi:membrane-associated phospholipid phosphatase
LIQQVFHFDRPESIVQPLIEHIPDNSFPSDHAAVSFAFLFAILFSNYKKTFLIFFPFVILMNLSRIA